MIKARWITLSLLVFAMPASAVEISKWFKRADQQAHELLEQEQYEEAAALFENSDWRGVSQYRAGKYEEAMNDFSASNESGLFNRGTAAARAGDYEQAVESLEAALERAPDDDDIKHNLDIARKLKELSENKNEQQQEGEDQQSDDQEESDSEQNEDSNSEQEQSEQEQSGDQSGDQSGEEPSESDQQSESDQNDPGGELSTEPGDSESEESQDLEFSDLDNEESDQPSEQEAETSMAADTTVSEDDQATEQWLRRIPDDPSQLLRNKIRLNHMIEYPEVNHMQEPW